MLKIYQKPFIQEINEDWIVDKGLRLFIKREDLIHPTVSGNKWRKLQYNLAAAREQGHHTLLTFGGAYSNHIYATAAAAAEAAFKSIGVIRGEELGNKPLNHTLSFAKEKGMLLFFVDRERYRTKHEPGFINKLKEQFGRFYLIPEGGTNNLAIKGSEEIVNDEVKQFDVICLPVGTGGTISGVIAASSSHQKVIGFSALKGNFLRKEVGQLLDAYQVGSLRQHTLAQRWQIETDYHFGGYAKMTTELLDFISAFEKQHHIPLDPIYTGKMMYGVFDKIRKGAFKPGTRILTIHTGGLQGAKGII